MALARTRRGESAMNYWPGFVDALSTLILGIIFLPDRFCRGAISLEQEVANKDSALSRLNTQVAQLSQLLSMEKSGKADLEGQLVQLRASLANVQSERDRLKAAAESAQPPRQPRKARQRSLPANSKARRKYQPAPWGRSSFLISS